MLDHDYTKKDVFIKNFWNDWRKVCVSTFHYSKVIYSLYVMHCICHVQEMTAEEAAHIKSFDKCDFTQIHQYFKEKSEAKKQLSKEEKQVCI